jgi:hypothetical protein
VQGVVYAFKDEPEKAKTSLEYAFADRSYAKYLGYLANQAREAVDLRGYYIEAIERIEKSVKLSPELNRARNEAVNFLRRPIGPPGKKGQ